MIASIGMLYLRTATLIVFMLQNTEYQSGPYLRWFWRTQDFTRVMHRRKLDPTHRARLLVLLVKIGILVQIFVAVCLIYWGIHSKFYAYDLFGIACLLVYPVVWAHLVILPILFVRTTYVKPRQTRSIQNASMTYAGIQVPKIAVIGSYGKTTMKELLVTVMEAGLKVSATPANKNVLSSQAAFVRKLDGSEDAVIVEFGEGAPGDIPAMARLVKPDYAIITGIAPAHLDRYKTLDAAAADILSIRGFVKTENTYANGESVEVRDRAQPDMVLYSSEGIGDWHVDSIRTSITGTHFRLKKGKDSITVESGLLGRHQIGPLAAAAALAFRLGLTAAQIEDGLRRTRPYEHRMNPYQLHGAWVIDDTYNGNLEGIRAGTALLSELPASRKWYVTPGLVDQGKLSDDIHLQVGKLIAGAHPEIVVLMKNSATEAINKGLQAAGYDGEIRMQDDPLQFYRHLDQFVGVGDLVMMQNDWTDNYA